MKKPRLWKPRLRLFKGQWYAFAPNNSFAARRALVPAISFCRRLNTAKAKGGVV